MMMENKINYYIKMTNKPNNTEFVEWLSKCPTNYDEILETSDNDIITINFHGKNIYKEVITSPLNKNTQELMREFVKNNSKDKLKELIKDFYK